MRSLMILVATTLTLSLGSALGCAGSNGNGDITGGEPGSPSSNASTPGAAGSSDVDKGSSGAFDGYFGAPSGAATPDRIFGLWGGSLDPTGDAVAFDVRMRVEEGRVTFAHRCMFADDTKLTAGVRVRARVDEDEMTVLESKEDKSTLGDKTCSSRATPIKMARCDAKDLLKRVCFDLEGTVMTIHGERGLKSDQIDLIKLSD